MGWGESLSRRPGEPMATDRLARLLADLEAQGIDAARLRTLASSSAVKPRCDCISCSTVTVLRALADAAAEPERPERCPACGWMGSGCDTCDEGAAAECRRAERTPEDIARRFHDTYERLAPNFNYQTRRESAVPWDEVPENNRRLMIATVTEVLSDCLSEEHPRRKP